MEYFFDNCTNRHFLIPLGGSYTSCYTNLQLLGVLLYLSQLEKGLKCESFIQFHLST
eukprot:c38846_g1_i1 orf=134-304(+)